MSLLSYVDVFRYAWFAGRFGGGKTAAAVHTALALHRAGAVSRIVSNTPLLRWERVRSYGDYRDALEGEPDSAFLVDEAWCYLAAGQWKEVYSFLAYLRKRNQYLLMASVLPLTGAMRRFVITRRWSGLPFGVPLWIYRFEVDTGVGKDIDKWLWWFPARVFREYDHTALVGGSFDVYEPSAGAGSESGDGDGYTGDTVGGGESGELACDTDAAVHPGRGGGGG